MPCPSDLFRVEAFGSGCPVAVTSEKVGDKRTYFIKV
jgi:hypothetical protein